MHFPVPTSETAHPQIPNDHFRATYDVRQSLAQLSSPALHLLGLAPLEACRPRHHLDGWRAVNLHTRVQVWVGGQRAPGVAPNDPVFWLHHAYIDKLWADWQRRHPGSGYVPAAGTPNVIDINDTMKPWNDVRPADLLDHTAHYTFDAA